MDEAIYGGLLYIVGGRLYVAQKDPFAAKFVIKPIYTDESGRARIGETLGDVDDVGDGIFSLDELSALVESFRYTNLSKGA